VQSIAERASSSLPAAPSVRVVPQSSEMCAECNTVGLGRVDDVDGNFYCDVCWSQFLFAADEAAAPQQMSNGRRHHGVDHDLGADANSCDFWGGPDDSHSLMGHGAHGCGGAGVRGSDVSTAMQGAELHRWTRSRVNELLPRDQDSFLDPDVVVSALLAAETFQDLRTDAQNLMSSSPGVQEFVKELWQRRRAQGQNQGQNCGYLEHQPQQSAFVPARALIAGPTGSFRGPQGAEYRMQSRVMNTVPAMCPPTTQTVEAYVHVRFQELGLNMPEIENYVADVLKMKDDELSPLDDAMEQIEDLLRGLGVQDHMVREFVRNAPVAASVF